MDELMKKLSKLIEKDSYSVRIISKWLDDHSFKYTKKCSGMGMEYINKRVLLTLNDKYILSIQTDDDIVLRSGHFAETALIKNNELSNDLDYNDVICHYNPEDLYKHILDLMSKL